jgi:hypothetical protein
MCGLGYFLLSMTEKMASKEFFSSPDCRTVCSKWFDFDSHRKKIRTPPRIPCTDIQKWA